MQAIEFSLTDEQTALSALNENSVDSIVQTIIQAILEGIKNILNPKTEENNQTEANNNQTKNDNSTQNADNTEKIKSSNKTTNPDCTYKEKGTKADGTEYEKITKADGSSIEVGTDSNLNKYRRETRSDGSITEGGDSSYPYVGCKYTLEYDPKTGKMIRTDYDTYGGVAKTTSIDFLTNTMIINRNGIYESNSNGGHFIFPVAGYSKHELTPEELEYYQKNYGIK